MQGELLAAVTGIIGLVLGIVIGAAVAGPLFRTRSGRLEPSPSQEGGALPPGIAEVLSALPSSAVVLDSGDKVLRASSAARAFGLVRGEELVIGELLSLARKVRRDGVIRETDIEVAVRKFGPDATSFAVRVAPLGGTGLVLVLAEDQTEHRRVEAVRRDFVANISHELKTPVGALSLLAETVQDASDDPEAVRRFTARMQTEATRLTAVIQDLITLSRIQGAEPIAEPAPVDLEAVVEEAIDAVRMPADAKGIELVGSGAEGLTVLGDEAMLGTALRNLITNAVAYSPKNTRVAVSVGTSRSSIDISVADQGIGIPQQDLERIFERFYRVDAARSRATGGTGLGLAIVKHIMTHHRGEVTVWSKEGSGSTFTLRLPRPESREIDVSRNDNHQETAQ
ncbi:MULTISPECIES: sensor histidine kinase [Nocardiopsis]|uniref:Sensor-like histidine kinase SenX3 n=2 Tax=Nocardiopsis alba TaxID=53437 RepID=A0A7K2IRN0_9ACTN|nr:MULTISPECIES: ATP-binding protein [Nocardiopsis]AFR05678.1 his Kinase A domain protein [Nocardiopsis alba ATCC BAA-2165]MEC3892582.1 ATP-binding protein [Nocardiopsis sp. LDBS1602]MYR32487.1 two-component sensor histidine kinase [Nocardiopsis alba]